MAHSRSSTKGCGAWSLRAALRREGVSAVPPPRFRRLESAEREKRVMSCFGGVVDAR